MDILTGSSDPQSNSQISLSSGGPGPLCNHTSGPAKWHLIPSNGLSKVHECDRRHHTTVTPVKWPNRYRDA